MFVLKLSGIQSSDFLLNQAEHLEKVNNRLYNGINMILDMGYARNLDNSMTAAVGTFTYHSPGKYKSLTLKVVKDS